MATRYPFAVIKEKLHARRGEVTDFAMGTRKLELPRELRSWIADNTDIFMRAASPDAVREFLDAAIELVSLEYGIDMTHEQIVPIPGGRVAMTAVAACVLEPGDGVLVTEPGYPAFARLASHWHADAYPVMLDPDKGFAPDFSAVTDSDFAAIRIFSLNYPNNPSGGVLSQAAQQEILSLAENASALVFNDNVYGPLTFDSKPVSLMGRPGGANVVELHALTKLYPIGPQGASFLAGTTDTMAKIANYSEFAWAPMSGLQVGATSWCFRDSKGRRAIRDFFHGQLSALTGLLQDIGFKPYPVPAGIYALCRVPESIAGKTVTSAGEAAMILMDEFDVAVVPFDSEPHRYLRFTSMYKPEDLEKLRTLGDTLKLD